MPRQWSALHQLHPKDDAPNCSSVDVVLVHGLDGHFINTWKSPDDEDDTLWPSHFLPHHIHGVRVLSYSYSASVKGSTNPHMVRNRAQKLLQLLKDRRSEGNMAYIPIIFVGHSLGGVIVKQALRNAFDNPIHYKEIAISTYGVVFFSTPHFIGNVELWQRYVSDVVSCHLPGDDPTHHPDMSNSDDMKPEHFQNLSQVTEDFASLLMQDPKPFEVVSFLEDDKTVKLNRKVVDDDIGRLGLGEMAYTLTGDHIGVCQFSKHEKPFFREVGLRFERILQVARSSKRLDDQHRHVLASLCSEQFHSFQLKFAPTEGTCRWIEARAQFNTWRENNSENNKLWISGEMASGKTHLARYIIKRMLEAREPGYYVIQCFLSQSLPERDTLQALLRSTTHQAVTAHPEFVTKHLLPHYQEAMRTGNATDAWKTDVLVQIWPSLIVDVVNSGKKQVVIVIDGFDEISDEDQDVFLGCFKVCEDLCDQQHICREPCQPRCQRLRPRLLILSRNCTSLENLVPRFVKYLITLTDTFEDISNTVRKKLNRFARHMHYLPGLQDEVCTQLAREARGMYLWATVMIRDLEHRLLTESDLRRQLNTLPRELVELYDQVMGRLRNKLNDDAFDVKALLQWVVLRQESLSANELGTSLALARLRRNNCDRPSENYNESIDDTLSEGVAEVISDLTAFRQRELPYGQARGLRSRKSQTVVNERILQSHRVPPEVAKKAFYNLCGQLLRFTEDDVEPIHSSLTEYLTTPTEHFDQEKAPNHKYFHIPLPGSHATLGNLCTTYLAMHVFANAGEPFNHRGNGLERWESKVRARVSDHDFARYTSLCWSRHLNEAMNPGVGYFGTTSADVRHQKLLEGTAQEPPGYAISWLEIWWLFRRWPKLEFPTPRQAPKQIQYALFHDPRIRDSRQARIPDPPSTPGTSTSYPPPENTGENDGPNSQTKFGNSQEKRRRSECSGVSCFGSCHCCLVI